MKWTDKKYIIALLILVVLGAAVWAWAIRYQDPVKHVSTPGGWRKITASTVTLFQNESAGKWFSLETLPASQCAPGTIEERVNTAWNDQMPDEAHVNFVYHDSVTETSWEQPGAHGNEKHWCLTKESRSKAVEISTAASDTTTREYITTQVMSQLYPGDFE